MSHDAPTPPEPPRYVPAPVTVPQPAARRWIDLDEEDQVAVARALQPQRGGPLRLAAIVGSPVAAALAASIFGTPIGQGMAVFWVSWIGILIATLGPFALAAVRRRYDLQASGLSRAELRQARMQRKGHTHVELVQADLAALPASLRDFDVIACRRVLMYLDDPFAVLSTLAHRLRPGGLAVIQEHAQTGMPVPSGPLPLHAEVQRWFREMLLHEGADTAFGLKLADALTAGGLVVEHHQADAEVMWGTSARALNPIIEAIRARLIGAGVATADDLDQDVDAALARERRAAAAASGHGAVVWEVVVGAIAKRPVD